MGDIMKTFQEFCNEGITSKEDYEFGLENKENVKLVSAALKNASIAFKKTMSGGIDYFIFQTQKDLKCAEEIAEKVIDKTKESEW